MAHHYFQFRYVEYLEKVNSDGTRDLKRKDVCRQKQLFKFSEDRIFYTVDSLARETIPNKEDGILKRHLSLYRERHADKDIRTAIDVLLNNLNRDELRRFTANGYAVEIDKLRLAIATRTGWDYQRVIEVAEEVYKLAKEGEIW